MESPDAALSSRKIVNKFSLNNLYYMSWTRHLHDNEEGRKNLEKRSVRIYHQIFPLNKGDQKNLGITAIGRWF
ncbi:hypothetical protein PAECIP111890_05322 [Paenibacillus sp. JJ-223]|nr:hypothetical protein PAECIP111890_05322 [Paenibacillus sp. JJ-223]